MFDDDHAIAEAAQPAQRYPIARIIALMQADGGLIQHIKHAGQARADLRARRMRWLSPPDKVAEARARVR